MNRKDESLAMQIAARREADRLRAENEKLRVALKQTRDALAEADDELHYFWWGQPSADNERSAEKIEAALKAADDALNT